ncbi:hypothetical protein J5N97_002138 [Dioscorea zingiberensis]|uniref:AP2/ERF domain-containing protein n=1 Tax=Dioscorea zingiberensis TaxID=325984 RepID=A0A9D5D3I7_9LILI|nr:hypothetical protein J5N97_002138 [Dioscorea zingiberensis]
MARSESGEEVRFKGVRRRQWGKWVSEIRLPNSRERIWLGSYDTPEKAARAFDAASYCLRGRRAKLNFPETPPRISSPRSLTHQQIQAAAYRHANELSPAPAGGESNSLTATHDLLLLPPPHSDQSDASEGLTPESETSAIEAVDWSSVEFPAPMDDLYGYYPPEPEPEPQPDLEESGGSYNLWNFNFGY